MTDDETAGQPQGRYVSADFVFGTLATDDLRLAQLRARRRAGVHHGARPRAARSATRRGRFESQSPSAAGVHADHVTCYYTTDGSRPGRRSRSSPPAGRAVAFEPNRCRVGHAHVGLRGDVVRRRSPPSQPARSSGTGSRRGPSDDRASTWATETAGLVAGERPPGVDRRERPVLGADSPPLWPVPRHGSFAYHVDDERVPDWLRDAVIYQVFVDRFATTGGVPFARARDARRVLRRHAAGVIERLDHIAELGVTCLWLSPIFP